MKIQYLAIIFLIIILPMTLVLTIYNQSQINNLHLQLMYNTYLSDATHNAVKAFELNTVNNSFSELADSLKRDVEAAVNVFLNSMASSLGTSGATAEAVSEYVPAVLFTLYDGYYIYAQAYSERLETVVEQIEGPAGDTLEVTVAQSKEEPDEDFGHIVKPYVYYTMRYVKGSGDNSVNNTSATTDFIVNYTLDNYITVYGKINGNYVTKAGYLLELNTSKNLTNIDVQINQNKLKAILKRDVLKYRLPIRELENKSLNEINSLYNQNITGLKEYINTWENGSYRTKLVSNMSETLLEHILDNKSSDILLEDIPISKIEEIFNSEVDYITIDVSNNVIDEVIDCFDIKYDGMEITDRDAKIYYVKALQFSRWVNENLSDIQIKDAKDSKGNPIDSFKGRTDKIFDTMSRGTTNNNPEETTSFFVQHKNEVIKESIQSNLTASIARYNQKFFEKKHGYVLKMPILNDNEWESITNNVTMVTFMQGMIVGTKVFNDYSIVSSEKNKELVDIEQLYYFNRDSSGTAYYHKYDCPALLQEAKTAGAGDIVGYNVTDYEFYKEEIDDEITYRVGDDIRKELSTSSGITSFLAAYDCVVNRNYTPNETENKNLLYAKYVAIARERNQHYKVNSYMDTVIEK